MPSGFPAADNAIRRPSDDLLDRGRFTDLIAEELLAAPSDAGFVVGLTGAWGIGKTSVLNLVEAALGERATVIRFNPWLFSGADELVVRFFAEVADVLAPEAAAPRRLHRFAPRSIRVPRSQRDDEQRSALKTVASRMAAYGAALAPVGALVVGPLAELLAAPDALMRADQEAGPPSAGQSAQASHNALSEALRALDHKLVVFVDDFDRLTPDEIREVVRLVKLVGDLPNVVYVLAYDRPRVERALGDDVEDGRVYLEKIVQAPHAVPPIPTARLRQMCLEQLQDRLGDAPLEHFDTDRWSPLAEALLDYVRTLRDAKRYANAVATDLRVVGEEVAAQDVMALAALRVFDPDVHFRLPKLAPDLTGGSRRFDLRDESEKRKERRARIDKVLEQSRHPEITHELLRKLFPAASLDNVIYSGSDREWRAKRLVASPSVLDTYLYATVAADTLPVRVLHGVLETLDDAAVLRERLTEVSDAQLPDLLDRVRDHTERFPAVGLAPAAAEFLRLEPRLTAPRGMFQARPSWTVSWVLEDLLVSAQDLTAEVFELYDLAETLSGRHRVLSAFGTWPDSDPGERPHLSVEATSELQNRLFAEIRRTDEDRLAAEPDLRSIVARTFHAAPELVDEVIRPAVERSDALFVAAAMTCVNHTRSSAPPHDRYELEAEALERLAGPLSACRTRATKLLEVLPDLDEAQRRALRLAAGGDPADGV